MFIFSHDNLLHNMNHFDIVHKDSLYVCRGTFLVSLNGYQFKVEMAEPDPLNLLVNTSVGSK